MKQSDKIFYSVRQKDNQFYLQGNYNTIDEAIKRKNDSMKNEKKYLTERYGKNYDPRLVSALVIIKTELVETVVG